MKNLSVGKLFFDMFFLHKYQIIKTNLDNMDIYNIQLDASGKVLYIGTNGGSVYSMILN